MTFQSQTSRSLMANQPYTVRVPTATTTKHEARIDLRELSETDLDSLQRNDPFMYNSIPLVYKSNLQLEGTNNAELAEKVNADLAESIVSRKSRLSTESHMSVLIEDFLDMDDDDFKLECEQHGFDLSLPSLLSDEIHVLIGKLS
mmetsp:Transcript_27816/g.47282  ORF Transcript_27816/g.47282 Transcript_27816/m.47282 type:complete len:145 (+) Transcript_27816:146-580(+)|eukprot:CAMPEP_0183781588 /NCGR_PEP_ID=MMETSP0739-20130205/59180_1 /TAXON_ID=385413 /ORGANISM="Thalassiosira miniscula, Strain CCMP1093" /LENGTH=144 /DNA_ID=CAMNT_0026024819 /DNA_START=68 /DNA_END=502 /DNA_ORIENTATION=-